MQFVSENESQTEKVAADLAECLQPGSFLALTGDLGAGKTAFTRGLARGLGITENVSSPTFTLLKEYRSGRLPLYHFDVYRLGGSDELEDTGFYDCSGGDGVTVCEWADRIEDEIPEDAIRVAITRVRGTERLIEIQK